jgi:hypothetical protein
VKGALNWEAACADRHRTKRDTSMLFLGNNVADLSIRWTGASARFEDCLKRDLPTSSHLMGRLTE